MKQPNIETTNLILRPFTTSDSLGVAELAGDIRVAETTLNIPHPYSHDVATSWIVTHEVNWLNRTSLIYAVTLKSNSQLVGTVSLDSIEGDTAELGYWVGYEYWGKGYCTEAASALVSKAFESFSISVITAVHLSSNPASGCVMKKIGMMKYQSVKRCNRNGLLSDIEVYKIRVCT